METERNEFINLTMDNLTTEHLCCIIRTKSKHPGVEAKRAWLKERLAEGHVFRKLNAKGTVFIEYAPLESAWVPIEGENYLYIYCLWVSGEYKGKGYGRALLQYCIDDAKAQGKSGICLLGSDKQKGWLTDQGFAEKHGFQIADHTDNGYRLYALSFDGTVPRFTVSAKQMHIEQQELTVYYDHQCPYVLQVNETIQSYCASQNIPVMFHHVNGLQEAKTLPCVFNNWAVFYQGQFVTVNLLPDLNAVKRILKR